MPLPTQSDVLGLAGYPCPEPALQLSSVTAAFNDANSSDQASFIQAIQPPLFTLAAIRDAYENANQNDQQNFRTLLGITDSGNSGGSGSGYTLTAAAIEQALAAGDAPTIDLIMQQLAVPLTDGVSPASTELETFIANLPVVQNPDNLYQVLTTGIGPGITLGVVFHFGPGINDVAIAFDPVQKRLVLTGDIYLGDPPLSTEPTTPEPFPITQCQGGMRNSTTINFPQGNNSGFVYWTLPMVQNLFLKIEQLLACCEPCYSSLQEIATFEGVYYLNPPYNNYILRAVMQQNQLDVPIDEYDADLPWRRFGRFMFVDSIGNTHDMGYIRYTGQIFIAPASNIVACQIILNPGVHMTLFLEYGIAT